MKLKPENGALALLNTFTSYKRSAWFVLLMVGLASLSAEVRQGFIAGGTPEATPFYIQDSGTTGPVVMITGGFHGDEPAGATAAEQIGHWPVQRGKLIVIPRANELALKAKKRETPGLAKNLANLNRNFSNKNAPNEPQGTLATGIWNLVKEQNPGWIVDLHESGEARAIATNRVGNSIIVYSSPEANLAVDIMLAAVNTSATNEAQEFLRLRSPIGGSLARAAGDALGIKSMIIETTIKNQPLSLRTRQHRIMVYTLLKHLDMLLPEVTPERMTDGSLPKTTARVALYDAEGLGGLGVPRVTEILGSTTNVALTRICPEDIRQGALNQFDVIMITGGSGSKIGAALAESGRKQIKRFVENGGGYIGICAGAYLACSGFSWGTGVINSKTVSPLWQRGEGTVQIELTERGRVILGDMPGLLASRYANGPIVTPDNAADLPPYEVLGFFRTELSKNKTPVGVMINSPAVFAGFCGKGRALCFSGHPEQSKGLDSLVPRAVSWVAGVKSEGTAR
jgi:hypothetical protein